MAKRPHLFLDCDGVLADFDTGAKLLLGMKAKQFEARHGRGEFWKRLARHGNFYAELQQMPDAQQLFQAVKHLKPTILTGIPLGTWATPQKERWAAKHFPGVPIITTLARKKHLHMDQGDVLVDDRENHRKLWEDAGGIFVHHKTAEESLRQLAKIYPSVKVEAAA
jgi:FMN phosphatase YigB (HAD superfamily)